MPDNPVLSALLERRTTRKLKNTPVRQEDLEKILLAGIYAPTGKNTQLMRFMIIEGDSPRRDILAKYITRSFYLKSAPLLIVVLSDKDAFAHQIKDAQSMGACVQNMLLAAHSLGLGSVWIGEIFDAQKEFLPELGLDPARYDFHAVVCLGEPEAVPKAPERKALEEYIVG